MPLIRSGEVARAERSGRPGPPDVLQPLDFGMVFSVSTCDNILQKGGEGQFGAASPKTVTSRLAPPRRTTVPPLRPN